MREGKNKNPFNKEKYPVLDSNGAETPPPNLKEGGNECKEEEGGGGDKIMM
jgi:hypothetical protein